jgi:hypothetical protein
LAYAAADFSHLQELLGILQANTSAPQQLAALFEPFLHLLQMDPAGQANSFAAGKHGTGFEFNPPLEAI